MLKLKQVWLPDKLEDGIRTSKAIKKRDLKRVRKNPCWGVPNDERGSFENMKNFFEGYGN